MILEKETFKAFGYYPSELTHGSHKPILAACDDCGKVRLTTKHHYHPLCNSCAHKGIIFTEEHKALISASLKGRIFTEERKANISAGGKGKIFTEVHKAKLSAAAKGRIATDEARANMSAARKGENNPNWLGGVSFEPYCIKFNEEFKEYIRAKFGHTCFLCPSTQAENGRKLDVHHVSYNKDCGCDGDKTCNFVPLCHSCHMKTNHNRAYWQKLITDKLHRMIIGWTV